MSKIGHPQNKQWCDEPQVIMMAIALIIESSLHQADKHVVPVSPVINGPVEKLYLRTPNKLPANARVNGNHRVSIQD